MKCRLIRGILFLQAFISLFSLAYALDSSVNAPPLPVTAQSTDGPVCTYYFIDAFNGTELPGGTGIAPAPTGTSISLKFYNNVYNSQTHVAASSPTTLSTPTTCAGTFAIVFSIDIAANTDVTSITITPSIQDSLGTTIYPSAGAATTNTLYPECNNAGYAGTPYCTVGTVSGAVQVSLPQGDQILAPTLTASSAVTVVGGSLEIVYLPPQTP